MSTSHSHRGVAVVYLLCPEETAASVTDWSSWDKTFIMQQATVLIYLLIANEWKADYGVVNSSQ